MRRTTVADGREPVIAAARLNVDASFHMHWSRDQTIPALEFLQPLTETLLARLRDLINTYHRWSRSSAYYDLVCGEWLYHFAHVTYAAYLEHDRGASEAVNAAPIPVVGDHREFQQMNFADPGFTLQLRAAVAHVLSGKTFEATTFARSERSIDAPPLTRRQQLKYSVSRALSSRDAPFVFCEPYVKCGHLEWLSALRKWRKWARQDDYGYPIESSADVDQDWRRRRSADVRGVEFIDVVTALLPLYLPVLYLEALATYRRNAHALRLPHPRVLYTANSLHGHTLFKVLAADWREDGTRILNHQHGGGYGLPLAEATESFEVRVSDTFYSFGWSDPSSKVKPLTAPLSPRPRPQRTGRILLTMAGLPRFVYRIHVAPMPGTIETMFAETEDFVRRLADRCDLVVRPNAQQFGRPVVDGLRAQFPGLEFDDLRVSGPRSFARYALVVHNYLGTAWLETLAMNTPTVCFFDTAAWVFRRSALPYIDALETAGILHRSGASAATFVSGVVGNPDRWWQTPEVQEARRCFVSRYANFSHEWASHWEAEFQSVLEHTERSVPS